MDSTDANNHRMTPTVEPGITIHVLPQVDGTGNFDTFDPYAVHYLSESEAEDKWVRTGNRDPDAISIEIPCPLCNGILTGMHIPLFAVQTAFCSNVTHMFAIKCKRAIRIQK